MLGPRIEFLPTNSGRLVAIPSPFNAELTVSFCWSPLDMFARTARLFPFANALPILFSRWKVGAYTVLIVSAFGLLIPLGPRSRSGLVRSSIGVENS